MTDEASEVSGPEGPSVNPCSEDEAPTAPVDVSELSHNDGFAERLRAACETSEMQAMISRAVGSVDHGRSERWANGIRDTVAGGNVWRVSTVEILAAAVRDDVIWRALCNARQAVELAVTP